MSGPYRGGRIGPESVAGLPRNGWQLCSGISGRIGPEYAKQFADIVSRMKKANELRNNIIHGRWSYTYLLSDLVNIHGVEKRSITRDGKPKKSPISKSIVMDAANAALDTALKLEIILQVLPREKPKDWLPT